MASDSPGATTCRRRSPAPATTPGITWSRAGGAAAGSQSAPRGVRPSSCWSRTAAATRPLRAWTCTANRVMPGASASSSRTSWLPAATGTPRPAGASTGPSGPYSVMSTTAGAASRVGEVHPAALPDHGAAADEPEVGARARCTRSPRARAWRRRCCGSASRRRGPGPSAPVARATSGPPSAAATTDPASGASQDERQRPAAELGQPGPAERVRLGRLAGAGGGDADPGLGAFVGRPGRGRRRRPGRPGRSALADRHRPPRWPAADR